MGDMYVSIAPRCTTHGKMHLDSAFPHRTRYICHGFDGEGCDSAVEWHEIDWQKIGDIHFVSGKVTLDWSE
jgi:hypothetical protein